MLTLPLMGLFFLPVLIGAHDLFPWSRDDALATSTSWQHRHGYLNLPFFAMRGRFYFVTLSGLAFLLRRLSVRQDKAEHPAPPAKWIPRLSGGGLVFYVLSMNFASTDWVMSLESDWSSTIFVVILMAGQFLSALALMTVLLALVAGRRTLRGGDHLETFSRPGQFAANLCDFLDLRLLFAISHYLVGQFAEGDFVVSPSQFWWLERSRAFLNALSISRPGRTSTFTRDEIKARAAWRHRHDDRYRQRGERLLARRACVSPKGVRIHWLDFATLIAVGGFWSAMFLFFLARQPLLPLHPQEALRHG